MSPSRRRLAVLGAAAGLALAGCADGPTAEPTAHAAAGGVTVTATLAGPAGGGRELRITFAPQRPGFHVYSVDLPAGGVDGLGVPTRIAVRGDLAATGGPTADRPTHLLQPAGLPTRIPVYPDGPVTFTVPVRQSGHHRADVVVGYGACSENTCLLPVHDETLQLALD
ncbi:hypothetical protein [Kitasatospora sp. LaBMicrA B282]|uniref:hypothetical protein n=1 Tax=Kitasatospora sp. LaBMicrA B282 TaxID=3420949 RepID=UPI003D0E7524